MGRTGLVAAANIEIAHLTDFLTAFKQRHDDFHQHGCRLSDHGLNHCYAEECTEAQAAAAFSKVRGGVALSGDEAAKFASYLMIFFGHLDAEKGWTKQLHLGAYRNANARMLNGHGRDTGFDSIGDWPQVEALAALPGPAGSYGNASENHHLQCEPGGQLRLRNHDRQFSGRKDCRQNTIGHRAGGFLIRKKPWSSS